MASKYFDCGVDLPRRSELVAVGSEGMLTAPDPWLVRSSGLELERDGEVELVPVEQANRFQLELENLADAIRGRAEPLLGREDALGQAQTLEALHDDASRS